MKINKYVAELWHEPGMSPLSNPASRRMSNRTHEVLPGLMEKREMKMIGAYHLDPEHRSILIFEAKSVEDVRDVLYESGFMHWCDGRIFPTTPLPERFGSEADIRAVAGGCWLLTRAVTPFVATTNPKVSTTPSSNGFIS
jgi:hypothetical protein